MLNRHDEDTYIGFVIRCGVTTAQVAKAFALSTTFTPEQQAYILQELRTFGFDEMQK